MNHLKVAAAILAAYCIVQAIVDIFNCPCKEDLVISFLDFCSDIIETISNRIKLRKHKKNGDP